MKLSAKANYGNWVPANMMKMLYIATAAIIAMTVVLFIVLVTAPWMIRGAGLIYGIK